MILNPKTGSNEIKPIPTILLPHPHRHLNKENLKIKDLIRWPLLKNFASIYAF